MLRNRIESIEIDTCQNSQQTPSKKKGKIVRPVSKITNETIKTQRFFDSLKQLIFRGRNNEWSRERMEFAP